MVSHSSILAGRIPWTQEPGGIVHGVTKESDTTECLSTHTRMLMKTTFVCNIYVANIFLSYLTFYFMLFSQVEHFLWHVVMFIIFFFLFTVSVFCGIPGSLSQSQEYFKKLFIFSFNVSIVLFFGTEKGLLWRHSRRQWLMLLLQLLSRCSC